ncbi:AAA family ATPase [Pseudoalteromonas arctica]|uniref:McrB family protein n=1 Tax=Pseudoalteromonas arctica TaxID=394751 RepID=UPI001C9C1E5B|nr:AAA family ATPase [Pseudoalteromonas arctica]MBZ2194291.1 AAA family ATPase [Pseudoalteromonas arctica]
MNIQEYCLNKNFYFDDETLYNFHCCLQTKPFTILYGPSGTGKSKIAELYAAFICDKNGLDLNEHLCFVPVRPNWTSPSDLMGFYDYLNNRFVPSDFYNFMVKAEADQNNPYFLILDEMNLSVVEHYFSDFLACIESRRLSSLIDHDISDWESLHLNKENTSLSQVQISAFLELVLDGTLSLSDSFGLEVIRDHHITTKWREDRDSKKKLAGGNVQPEQNWKAQFRSEFNQGDNRLAHRFFEPVSSGVYKFKKEQEYRLNELTEDILKKLEKLKSFISQHELEIYKKPNSAPQNMEIPLNLYIIGTINMDESTHALSSKVLDRANTIEMNNVSRDILTTQAAQDGSLKVDHLNHDFSTIKAIPTINSAKKLNQNKPELIELIYSINDGLNPYRTNMGHRSIFEITHYVNKYIAECNDESLAEEALDLQFCQKLIPKLMGADERVELSILHTVSIITTGELNNPDHVLNADMTQYKYPKTLNKLQRMYKYYTQNGFVNFANV